MLLRDSIACNLNTSVLEIFRPSESFFCFRNMFAPMTVSRTPWKTKVALHSPSLTPTKNKKKSETELTAIVRKKEDPKTQKITKKRKKKKNER